MTDVILVALITAIPPTIVAAAGWLVALKNGRKADGLSVKTDEIHILVNSKTDKLKMELAEAKLAILQLETRLAKALADL